MGWKPSQQHQETTFSVEQAHRDMRVEGEVAGNEDKEEEKAEGDFIGQPMSEQEPGVTARPATEAPVSLLSQKHMFWFPSEAFQDDITQRDSTIQSEESKENESQEINNYQRPIDPDDSHHESDRDVYHDTDDHDDHDSHHDSHHDGHHERDSRQGYGDRDDQPKPSTPAQHEVPDRLDHPTNQDNSDDHYEMGESVEDQSRTRYKGQENDDQDETYDEQKSYEEHEDVTEDRGDDDQEHLDDSLEHPDHDDNEDHDGDEDHSNHKEDDRDHYTNTDDDDDHNDDDHDDISDDHNDHDDLRDHDDDDHDDLSDDYRDHHDDVEQHHHDDHDDVRDDDDDDDHDDLRDDHRDQDDHDDDDHDDLSDGYRDHDHHVEQHHHDDVSDDHGDHDDYEDQHHQDNDHDDLIDRTDENDQDDHHNSDDHDDRKDNDHNSYEDHNSHEDVKDRDYHVIFSITKDHHQNITEMGDGGKATTDETWLDGYPVDATEMGNENSMVERAKDEDKGTGAFNEVESHKPVSHTTLPKESKSSSKEPPLQQGGGQEMWPGFIPTANPTLNSYREHAAPTYSWISDPTQQSVINHDPAPPVHDSSAILEEHTMHNLPGESGERGEMEGEIGETVCTGENCPPPASGGQSSKVASIIVVVCLVAIAVTVGVWCYRRQQQKSSVYEMNGKGQSQCRPTQQMEMQQKV